MPWWLTIANGRAVCHDCEEVICNEPIYFHSAEDPRYRAVLCPSCGERERVHAHPSKKYREWAERERQLTLV